MRSLNALFLVNFALVKVLSASTDFSWLVEGYNFDMRLERLEEF